MKLDNTVTNKFNSNLTIVAMFAEISNRIDSYQFRVAEEKRLNKKKQQLTHEDVFIAFLSYTLTYDDMLYITMLTCLCDLIESKSNFDANEIRENMKFNISTAKSMVKEHDSQKIGREVLEKVKSKNKAIKGMQVDHIMRLLRVRFLREFFNLLSWNENLREELYKYDYDAECIEKLIGEYSYVFTLSKLGHLKFK